jgi:hypothetical protein
VPIKDGRDVHGIIFLANKQVPGGFTERDQELLSLFAGARRDRADQRQAVRAEPGTFGDRGTYPARP